VPPSSVSFAATFSRWEKEKEDSSRAKNGGGVKLIFMQQFLERLDFYTKNSSSDLFRINCVKRLSDGKFAALSCDPIYAKKPTEYFMDREGYVLDQLLYGGNFNDDELFFDSLQEALNRFQHVFGA
jgi:hypothetical protein